MGTIFMMLALLLGPWVVTHLLSRAPPREIRKRGAAAVGAGLLFAFTAMAHVFQTQAMVQMLPPWMPFRVPVIYLTGVLEFALAVGFMLPRARRLTGWIAIGVLLLFFPANIYAAVHHVPMGGHVSGPTYLLVRAPLQAGILFWIYWFTVRSPERPLPRSIIEPDSR